MAPLFPGRYTAQPDQPFVVFLLGMRINKLLAVRQNIATARAMAAMMRSLNTEPSHGFRSAEALLTWRGLASLQYWDSFEALERFAANPAAPHQPAWVWFNRVVRAGSAVGVWHETYLVQPGRVEVIYVNMPRFGLGNAYSHAPIPTGSDAARQRLYGDAPAPGDDSASPRSGAS